MFPKLKSHIFKLDMSLLFVLIKNAFWSSSQQGNGYFKKSTLQITNVLTLGAYEAGMKGRATLSLQKLVIC